jgi:tetratricopeptide (TPR) repeat protein
LNKQSFLLAKQDFSKGNYTQAINRCDQLLGRLGNRDDLLNLKALSLLALGQLEDAEKAILQAIKLNPRVAGMHLNAGQILQKLLPAHPELKAHTAPCPMVPSARHYELQLESLERQRSQAGQTVRL